MTSSDDALLAGFASGDPDAAAAFVRRFQGRVYGLAVSIIRDHAAAEDVAQEAFVRAWRHAETYDARRGRVLTWLLAIVRHVAIDAIRVKRAEPRDPELVAATLQLEGARTPADGALELAERERLREGLSTLPVEQRRALVLAAFFGRTALEVAELEQVPLGTAKTRIRTGLRRLRHELEVADER